VPIETLRDVLRSSESAFADKAWYSGTTAPNPAEYRRWFDTETGSFIAYVTDSAGSSQWVDFGRDMKAADNAALAQFAVSEAEAARDAATVNAAVYADTATALADSGLATGAQFQVVVGDQILRYRKDAGPVATGPLLIYTNGEFALSARRALGLGSSTPYVAFVAGSITPSISRNFTPLAATQYDIVAVVRGNNCDWVHLLCQSGGSMNHDCLFRLSTETIGRVNTALVQPAQTPTMRYMGGDRWELKVRILSTGTGVATLLLRPTLDGNFPMTGDTSRGMFIETWEVRLAGSETNLWSTGLITDAAFTKASLTASTLSTTSAPLTAEIGVIEDTAESSDVLMTGRLSGIRLTEAAGAGLNVRLFHPITLVASDLVVIRVRAKKAERFRLNLFANTAINIDATFDLNTRTGTGSGATVTHLGNDWCECTATATAIGGTTNFQVRVYPTTGGHPYTGDGVSSLFIEDVAVFVNGIKIIESRSEDFNRAIWTKNSITLTLGATRYIGIKQALVDSSQTPYNDGSAALVGLKTAVIGDSISSQGQYTGPLVGQTGITMTNLGASGACLASGSAGGSLAIYNQINSIPVDSELVLVQAGVNDFGTDNSDLGVLGDTTTATFYGAIHASVVAIRIRAPSAKIVFLTPYSGSSAHATHRHFRTNSKGHTLVQFQTAVKVGAAFAGCPVINVGEESGIGYHTPELFSDNLHITATGGLQYGTFCVANLRELVLAGVIQ
jgi:GDSL-like Lipase/Acylhydrolase family